MKKLKKNLYSNFEKKLFNNYKFLKSEEKTLEIFQLQFRLCALNESQIASTNLKKILKKRLRFRLVLKFFFYIYICLINLFISKPKIFFRSNTMSTISENILKSEFAKKNIYTIGTLSFKNKFLHYLKYIYSNTWYYDLCERTSEIFFILSKYKCDNSKKLIKLSQSKKFCLDIKKALITDCDFVKKVQNKINLQGVILNNDQTPFAYIFIEVANKSLIKTAVLAHGNFRNPFMVSVLPLRAQKIYVWSKKSETLINKNLKSRKAEFLKGIKYGIIQPKKKPKNILFVASPYKTIIKSNKNKIFNNILKTLKLNSSPGRLVYCAHPEDYRNNVLKRLLIKNQIIYSKNSAYYEASNARVVLGSHSSFLFESKACGIPTFQIKDICVHPKRQKDESVKQIRFAQLINKKIFKRDFSQKREFLKLDYKKIINFFSNNKKLISSI